MAFANLHKLELLLLHIILVSLKFVNSAGSQVNIAHEVLNLSVLLLEDEVSLRLESIQVFVKIQRQINATIIDTQMQWNLVLILNRLDIAVHLTIRQLLHVERSRVLWRI